MTIKYKFVTGEEVYVEVYGRLERAMTKLDYESSKRRSGRIKNECVSFESLNKNLTYNDVNPEINC